MIVSYTRVSTQGQSLDRQRKAIKDYCKVNNIKISGWFEDKASGKNFNRDNYNKMKATLQPGDVVIIKELDRFGRSYEDIKREWDYFKENKIGVIIIDVPLLCTVDNQSKGLDNEFLQNLVFEVMRYTAELERRKISERTKEALAVKKRQGVVLGRPKDDRVREALINDKDYKGNHRALSRWLGVSPARVSQVAKELKSEGYELIMGRYQKVEEK